MDVILRKFVDGTCWPLVIDACNESCFGTRQIATGTAGVSVLRSVWGN